MEKFAIKKLSQIRLIFFALSNTTVKQNLVWEEIMFHKQPINELNLKPNLDEREQRVKPAKQENVRNNKEGFK